MLSKVKLGVKGTGRPFHNLRQHLWLWKTNFAQCSYTMNLEIQPVLALNREPMRTRGEQAINNSLRECGLTHYPGTPSAVSEGFGSFEFPSGKLHRGERRRKN